MYQNYNYPQQQQQMMRPAPYSYYQSTMLKGRPVASLDEAKATSIDFDGSVFYFPDLANRRIYTKQINMDGTSSFNMYELKEIPTDQPISTSSFITREEFENTINSLKESLAQPQPQTTPIAQF